MDRRSPASTEQLEQLRRSTWQSEKDRGSLSGRYKPAETIDWSPSFELPEGWCWASVDQLAYLVQYGTSAKTDGDNSGVAVLRMGNIQDGQLNLTTLKYLPQEHAEFPELLLQHGDLLFNRTNSAELVGKTAIYKGTPERASFASYLIRVRSCGSCRSC